jgi:hypothetical protein
MGLPEPATRHALSILRFPDRRTNWVVLLAATAAVPDDIERRLAAVQKAVPVVGARLRDETWHPGAPSPVEFVDGDPLVQPATARRFDLARDAPIRVVCSPSSARIAIAAHHAAFDGLALVAILAALLGGPSPQPVASPPPGEPVSPWPAVRRLLRPADRVPPSSSVPSVESIAVRSITVRGRGTTARLAEACTTAVVAAARRRGKMMGRIGITLAVGGPAGVGNVATYRRLDVRPDDPVAELAEAALARAVEPTEQVRSPRALRALSPIVERFSDTVLVSNLGRHAVPGASRLEFAPVARGRSAVAFGAAGVRDGETTLSIRARDLSPADAVQLLEDAIEAYEAAM